MRTLPRRFRLWEAVDGLREAFAPRSAIRPDGSVAWAAATSAPRSSSRSPTSRCTATRSSRRSRRARGGAWKPSPGSVYPTLQLLADEGLVTAEQVGERKVYSLTERARRAAECRPSGRTVASRAAAADAERAARCRRRASKLAQAAAQVAHSGTPEQAERAVAIIDEARRKLYAILAED